MWKISALARLSFSAVLLVCPYAPNVLAAEVKLTWQVVQPFRFFRYPSDHLVQEWAYAEVQGSGVARDRVVSEMEKRLNSLAWWQGKPQGGDKSRRDMFDDLRRVEEEKLHRPFIPFDPRLGWASALRSEFGTSPATGTCWDPSEKSHKGCLSDIGQLPGGKNNDYIMPKRHMVELKVLEKTASGWQPLEGECEYNLGTMPRLGIGFLPDPLSRAPERQKLSKTDCSKPVYLRTEYKTTYPVNVSVAGSPPELLVDISVKDLLVVGIGDSFASGEGNPEVPALLDETRGVSPYIPASDAIENDPVRGVVVPTRRKTGDGRIAANTAARWLDDQCHRSIYSAQARAAIALAFEGERHHAITFASFACSGAEITDGVFWPQDHRECTKNADVAGPRLYQPQLSSVAEALSGKGTVYRRFSMSLDKNDRFSKDVIGAGYVKVRKENGTCPSWPNGLGLFNPPQLKTGKFERKIDLLLLSVGGNDIGFGPLVSKAVINSTLTNSKVDFLAARAILAYHAAARAIKLKTASDRIKLLDQRFVLLETALRKDLQIVDPKRVILSAYPRLSQKRNGFCGKGNHGMNISTLFSTVEEPGAEKVTARNADEIVSALNDKISDISVRYGWRVAATHVDRFIGHSFCDTDKQATGFKAKLEALDLPHKAERETMNSWKPFNPTNEFYPYESRARWVRTFNDAYLLSNYFKGFATDQVPVGYDVGLYQAQRALGGPMHPTAEGHSHMADALLVEARDALFRDGSAR